MDYRNNTRGYLLVLGVVVGLLLSGAGVAAVAQPDGDDVFTGCLNQSSGVLRNVAVGYEPIKPCNPEETQITWDRAGPAFEARIAALEERVAELEEPYGRLELFVDCAGGDTLGAAILEAEGHPGPVTITISGVCEENVEIKRGDVTIQGRERADGIRAASATPAVYLTNARGVRLENMTISGGTAGITATRGSGFVVAQVTVQETTVWAIWVQAGSTLDIYNSSIVDNANFGVTASGSEINVQDCLLSGNGRYGVLAEDGGAIWVWGSTISDNDEVGVVASGGAVHLQGSTIEGNGTGVASWSNSTITLQVGSRVANNINAGAQADGGSMLNIVGTVIENNSAQGILIEAQSNLYVAEGATIRDNGADGIELRDLSHARVRETEIRDNAGWGFNFAGPSATAEAQVSIDFPSVTFSGNTLGDTNLP